MQTIRSEQHHGTYADLASEYYDSKRHPTCVNFREASQALLIPWLRNLAFPKAHVLEIGAGRSIVSEWLTKDRKSVAQFIATDISLTMLNYSISNGGYTQLVVCDAHQLPFANSSFDLIVSSLGDPYNTIEFWKEVSRVLRTRAHALFTTPSFEWAKQFRNGDRHAYFATLKGNTIAVPSYVVSIQTQNTMIRKVGLAVTEYRHFREDELTTPHSPKLRPGAIVSGYVAQKEPT
jgi:ubiquinone/menaquinone biosynthesis C-methylase UbiE